MVKAPKQEELPLIRDLLYEILVDDWWGRAWIFQYVSKKQTFHSQDYFETNRSRKHESGASLGIFPD